MVARTGSALPTAHSSFYLSLPNFPFSDSNAKIMSTITMTGINTAQHIVQSLNSPLRADEDNEDNLINSEAMDELREIDRRMVRQVYGERSLSLVLTIKSERERLNSLYIDVCIIMYNRKPYIG